MSDNNSEDEDSIVEDEDEYVEKSPCDRWHRRSQTVQVQGQHGVNNSYLAMDMDEGKEVVWNEIKFDDEMRDWIKDEKSKRAVESVLKMFISINHFSLVKYYGYWIDRNPDTDMKIVFITEYTTAGTLRSFLRRSRINKKRIGQRVWRRWCRQVLGALSYLHICDPPVTHGHLNLDTIYIQHDGLIKVGSVAPNVIRDFLNALKRGENLTPYSAFYKTPNSKDLFDFGNCLLEIFASGLEYDPNLHNIYRDGENELNDEQKAGVLQNAGVEKQRFLELCFSDSVSALSLLSDSVFNEVPPLKVIAFYALKNLRIPVNTEKSNNYKPEENYQIIIINGKERKHKFAPLDLEKLAEDFSHNYYPMCGLKLFSTIPMNGIKPEDSGVLGERKDCEEEIRLILKVKCELNPSEKEKGGDIMDLKLEFQMSDSMIRQLDTEISIENDNPVDLVDELISFNLLNKTDRQLVIESLEECLEN